MSPMRVMTSGLWRSFSGDVNTRLVHYEGVFWNRAYDGISDMESRMYAKPEEIREYLEGKPAKPYISCEYMHAMGNSCGGMQLYTELEDQYEQYQGGFIWDFIDQAILYTDDRGRKKLAYGGDFDDRATDYEFCGNGIVYADRKPSPKLQEVKQLYAGIELFPDKKGVRIRNKNLFLSTERFYFLYDVLKDGAVTEQGQFEKMVPPSSEAYVSLPVADPAESGEYIIHVSAHLAENELWAERGYEVSFGQYVYQVGEHQKPSAEQNWKVIDGDVNIGVRGDGFSAQFSKAEGGLASLCSFGTEFITRRPLLTFWRALTDNDRGCKAGFDCAPWLAAGLYQKMTDVKVKKDRDSVTVRYSYQLPALHEVLCTISYQAEPNSTILVKAIYRGAKKLPDLPAFGME